MEEIILETKELCKQYHKQTVLKNINMRIPKGCVYGLLGANGAGKSTLMKILCGMTRADAGEVFFDGKIWSRKCIERIGALIELPPVYENLSAVDNLKVRTWTLGISDARILEVLDIVDLKNTGKKQVGKFSMGMKQRLGIAVALLNDPDFSDPGRTGERTGSVWNPSASGNAGFLCRKWDDSTCLQPYFR